MNNEVNKASIFLKLTNASCSVRSECESISTVAEIGASPVDAFLCTATISIILMNVLVMMVVVLTHILAPLNVAVLLGMQSVQIL